MDNLRDRLQAVNRELKAVTKKMEKLIAAADEKERPKTAKRTVTGKGVKGRAAETARLSKKAKAPARKPLAKRPKGVTGISTVLSIINRSKKGVDVPSLEKRTGFGARKIYAAVKALKKQGKVKTVRRGVYARA